MRTIVHALVVLVVLFLGVSVSAQGTTASPVQDAQGDAEDIFGQGPPLHDLDVISVTIMGPALAVEVSFFTAIAPPSAQGFLSVLALVEFDTDQDDSTGEAPIQNDFPPLPVLSIGVDYIANIVSEFDHPGLIDIQDAATGAILETVEIEFQTFSFSFTVPLTALGNDDGIVNYTAACGSFAQPTDAMDIIGFSTPGGDPFFRGDCSGNGIIDLADPIFLLVALAGTGDPIECEHGCDSNDDGFLDVSDAVYSLSYMFIGGPPPAAPFPSCGFDSTTDDLSCEYYLYCLE